MLYSWKGLMPSAMESRGGRELGALAAETPQLCHPPPPRHQPSYPGGGSRGKREDEEWAGGRAWSWFGQDGCQPPGTADQGVRAPWQPPLTLDKGCGGCPIVLYLPARAAVLGHCCHLLPLQDVGDHWGRRCLPVHPEAVLTPGHGPEPGQGLTCTGQAAIISEMVGEGSTSPTSPSVCPALESALSSPWLCTPWQPARGEQSPGDTQRFRALPSPFLSRSTTSVGADSPAAL